MTVLTTLHKRSLHFDLGAEQVLPLVPACIPDEWDYCRVKEHLQLSARVAVESTVIVEVELPQGRAEAPLPVIRKEGRDVPDKESLAVTGALARHDDRSKTAVGKEYWYQRRVRQQSLVTGPQFRLRQDVEGPFQDAEIPLRCPRGTEFKFSKPEGEAQFGRRGAGRNAQDVE